MLSFSIALSAFYSASARRRARDLGFRIVEGTFYAERISSACSRALPQSGGWALRACAYLLTFFCAGLHPSSAQAHEE